MFNHLLVGVYYPIPLPVLEMLNDAGLNPPGCRRSSSGDKNHEYSWIHGDSRAAPREVPFPDVHRAYSVVPFIFSYLLSAPDESFAQAMLGKRKSSGDQVSIDMCQ